MCTLTYSCIPTYYCRVLPTHLHTQTVSVYLHAVKRQPTVQCSSSRRLCERGHCRLHTNVQFGLTSCANFYNDHFLVLLFCSHNISLFFFMSWLLVWQQFCLRIEYIPKVLQKTPFFGFMNKFCWQ